MIMSRTRATAVVLAGAALGFPAAADARPTGPPQPVLLHAPSKPKAAAVAYNRAHHLRHRAVSLVRKLHRKHHERHVQEVRRHNRAATLSQLNHRVDALHEKLAAKRAPAPAPASTPATGSTASPTLEAIAQCESGGDPTADTGNGFYGKYQFTWSTWQSVGGTGNPAAAPEAEQDARAAQLYAEQGSAPWPVCGR
jgi:Transglycosylase-like domain